MGRLRRFEKLERARPDAGGDGPAPQTSGRFAAIAGPVDAEPAPPAHDPFAPPPEAAGVELRLAEDPHARRADQVRAERRALAEAELAARQLAAQRAMEDEAAEVRDGPLERLGHRLAIGPLARLSVEARLVALLGAVIATLVLGALAGGVVALAIAAALLTFAVVWPRSGA